MIVDSSCIHRRVKYLIWDGLYTNQSNAYQMTLVSCVVTTVFIRIVAGAIIYFEAYFPQNIISIFEKINISENLIILADQ